MKKLLMFYLVCVVQPAVAYTSVSGAKVVGVELHRGGGYLVISKPLSGGATVCSSSPTLVAFNDDKFGQNVLSMAYIALSTGKAVSIYVKDTCPNHQQNVSEVSTIYLEN